VQRLGTLRTLKLAKQRTTLKQAITYNPGPLPPVYLCLPLEKNFIICKPFIATLNNGTKGLLTCLALQKVGPTEIPSTFYQFDTQTNDLTLGANEKQQKVAS